MNAKLLVAGIVGFCILRLAISSKFADCGSNGADLQKVEVTNCNNNNSPRCVFRRNKVYAIRAAFLSKKSLPKLRTVLYGTILGVDVPFIGYEKTDTCRWGSVRCPLVSGQNFTFADNIVIEAKYPKVRVDIKIKLLAPNDEVVLCIAVPAQIQ